MLLDLFQVDRGIPGTKFNPFKSQIPQTTAQIQHLIKVDCKVCGAFIVICVMF